MKLSKLIAVANEAYPGDMVARYWNNGDGIPETAELGDGLAQFVACELDCVYDPKLSDTKMLEEAANALDKASEELAEIADVLRATPVEDSDTEMEN